MPRLAVEETPTQVIAKAQDYECNGLFYKGECQEKYFSLNRKLRKAMQLSTTTAKLLIYQACIEEEGGFPSWPDFCRQSDLSNTLSPAGFPFLPPLDFSLRKMCA